MHQKTTSAFRDDSSTMLDGIEASQAVQVQPDGSTDKDVLILKLLNNRKTRQGQFYEVRYVDKFRDE